MISCRPRLPAGVQVRGSRGRARATVAACLIAGAVVAGCGSSNTPSGGSNATGTTQSASAHGGTSAEVASAAKIVAQYEKLEPTIPQQAPLRTKPPTGKTFVYTQCEEF